MVWSSEAGQMYFVSKHACVLSLEQCRVMEDASEVNAYRDSTAEQDPS